MTGTAKFASMLILSLGLLAGAHALPVYDAGDDFSFANNPNGVWSYGYETTLGGAFIPYTDTVTITGIQFWRVSAANFSTPNAGFNPTAANISFSLTTFRPGELTLHPGPNGEFSVARFTAPAAGSYSLNSLFNMRSSGGSASTDVHVLLNNVAQFNNVVSGLNDQEVFNASFSLAVGDRLDFVVGSNGSFLGDTTELRANLDFTPRPVSEPGTLLMAVLGLGLIGMRGRRRDYRSR